MMTTTMMMRTKDKNKDEGDDGDDDDDDDDGDDQDDVTMMWLKMAW